MELWWWTAEDDLNQLEDVPPQIPLSQHLLKLAHVWVKRSLHGLPASYLPTFVFVLYLFFWGCCCYCILYPRIHTHTSLLRLLWDRLCLLHPYFF